MSIDKKISAIDFFLIIPVTLIWLAMASPATFGDIGSKYQEKHKPEVGKKTNQTQAQAQLEC